MKLTAHFQLSEFTHSAAATLLQIDNTPNQEHIANIKNLCINVLEPLRQYAGQPIIISSGYRCPKLNKAVGGVCNSQHLKGEAADIATPIYDEEGFERPTAEALTILKDWFVWIMENTNFDQLIMERASKSSSHYWIHVSCKSDPSKNRHQVKFITKS